MESIRYERNNRVEWLNEKGKHHRTDGPAVEWANGDREWCVNDKLHRIDGPAFESANGGRAWWVNGHLHRTDGPAVEYANGVLEWWENGKLIPNPANTEKESIYDLIAKVRSHPKCVFVYLLTKDDFVDNILDRDTIDQLGKTCERFCNENLPSITHDFLSDTYDI